MQAPLLVSLALSLFNNVQALPHASYAPAPSPAFRLPHALRSRQVSPDCDLSDALDNITVPFGGCNPALPAPDDSLFLASVIIGRGIQNYTCSADPTAKPTAIGAIATLYEASCIAASSPDLLSPLTSTALTLPLPADPQANLVCDDQPLQRAGHHFFTSTGTPAFDFTETADDAQLGLGLMALDSKSDAPADAADNVPWLLLKSAEGADGQVIRQIYRVETRGGQPPANCEGREEGEVVSVEYSAQYWVLSSDE